MIYRHNAAVAELEVVMNKYKKIKRKDGTTYDEHRILANADKLGFDKVVHHKNGDKLDNRPENLEIYSRSDHAKLHGFGKTVHGNRNRFEPDEKGEAVCRVCGKKKLWDNFVTNKTWSNGKTSMCKQCEKEYKKSRRIAAS
jgi:superfamily II helicase